MALSFLRSATGLKRRYEPKPKFGHYSGAVGGQCFIFAGVAAKTKEESVSSTVLEVFDQYLEEWKALRTTGSPPKGPYLGGCCIGSTSGEPYVYGGYDGCSFYGGLYKLSSLLEWRQLTSESDAYRPSRKGGCRITSFNGKKIAVIGGYGPPPDALQPGASFMNNKRLNINAGWNNEIHVFDTEESKPNIYNISIIINDILPSKIR